MNYLRLSSKSSLGIILPVLDVNGGVTVDWLLRMVLNMPSINVIMGPIDIAKSFIRGRRASATNA